jgi:CHRD domain
MSRSKFAAAAAAAFSVGLLFAVVPAQAETITFKTDLKGSEETPPTDSAGKGTVNATYDTATKKLTWTIIYSGMTGPATMAHFHGPAPVGKAAGVEVNIPNSDKSPIEGSATLTDAQSKDLMDGMLYVNIHTEKNKAGELRGQLVK